MPANHTDTCWTLIRGAARGRAHDREEFARCYLPTVHAYLSARWRTSPLLGEIDDVVQEVFIACFREGGALDRLDSKHASGFRALLYSVTRNVALHTERTRARRVKRVADGHSATDRAATDDATLSRVFDREYALAIVRTARQIMERTAAAASDQAAQRRVELLTLRFDNGLPIREIAKRWDEDPKRLHREYAKASREFKASLAQAVADAEHLPPSRLDAECERLLGLLRE